MKYSLDKIKIEKLVKMIEDKKIYLKPNLDSSEYDYKNLDDPEDGVDSVQRATIWTKSMNVNLIKTVLSDQLLPAIILLEKDKTGFFKYSIIDGKQRLNSIYMYYKNKFKYNKNDLNEVLNKKYSELSTTDKNKFLNFDIPVITIKSVDLNKDMNIIKEIFESLNVNSTKLKPQEIRHAIYHNDLTAELNNLHKLSLNQNNYSDSILGKFLTTRIFNDAKLFNRTIDEFIVKLIRLFLKGEIIDDSKPELDIYYKEFSKREFFETGENSKKTKELFFEKLEEVIEFYIFIESAIPTEIRKPIIIYIIFYFSVISEIDGNIKLNLLDFSEDVFDKFKNIFSELNSDEDFTNAIRNQNQKNRRQKMIDKFFDSYQNN